MPRCLPLLCLLLMTVLLGVGCQSRIVGLRLDWNAPMSFTILDGEREVSPGAPERRRLARLLETYLPRMRFAPGPPLEAAYRLRMVGQSPEGQRIEWVFYLGPNWIGTSGRLAQLRDDDASSMRQLINYVVAEDFGAAED